MTRPVMSLGRLVGLFGAAALATAQAWSTSIAANQDEKQQLRRALKDTAAEEGWIYDDLAAGFAEARRTGKPLLVVLRCVP